MMMVAEVGVEASVEVVDAVDSTVVVVEVAVAVAGLTAEVGVVDAVAQRIVGDSVISRGRK